MKHRRKGRRKEMSETTPENQQPVMDEMDEAEEATEATCGETAEEAKEADNAKEAEAEVNPLQAQLDAANAKTAEYLAMAQRIQADFENFRRRNEAVRADSFAEGRRDVASSMLNVLDNLERALAAAENSTDTALKSGVELVLKQMNEVYKKLDVTPIDRLGEKFDPNLENAVLQGAPEDGEPGTVCMVLQKGYKMGERVLRHAMVKVVPD